MRLRYILGTALFQNPILKKAILTYQGVCAYLYIHTYVGRYVCSKEESTQGGKSRRFSLKWLANKGGIYNQIEEGGGCEAG